MLLETLFYCQDRSLQNSTCSISFSLDQEGGFYFAEIQSDLFSFFGNIVVPCHFMSALMKIIFKGILVVKFCLCFFFTAENFSEASFSELISNIFKAKQIHYLFRVEYIIFPLNSAKGFFSCTISAELQLLLKTIMLSTQEC